jgi:hypothetical protein
VRQRLYGHKTCDGEEVRRQAAKVTGLLRLLRGHRLIGKVGGTHYYRATRTGTAVFGAALYLREADLSMLAA